jgi:DNA helicase-2/ATP-dependent DNA helicase PcrA
MRAVAAPIQSIERRVYGPPGTGKTTWLAKRAREMADEFGADQVSICSMTRAAVREVAGRDLPLPDENVTTLHARCKRAIHAGKPAESRVREFAKEFPAYATAECLPPGLIRGAHQDDDTDEVLLAGAGITMYEHCQILRQRMVPQSEWSPRVLMWHRVWRDWCASAGVLDFTGWLEAALEPGVLQPQQVLFVDEAQDHTPLQLAVVRAWDVRYRYLIGDDDQNIYEWSGAVPKAFLSPELAPEDELVLAQSYRVPRAVHSVAMRWLEGVRYRKRKEYMPRDHEGEVDHSEYSLVSARMGVLPDGAESSYKRTMILASCAYMLNDVLAALKQEGIPFHNPYRRTDARWNPLGKTLSTVKSLMVGDRDWTGSEALRWASVLSDRKAFVRGGKTKFLERCKETGDKSFDASLLGLMADDASDMAVAQDAQLFDRYRMTGATGDWQYTLRVIRNFGADVNPWVIVGTIHSVKGGEADDVVLFPDLSPAGYSEYMSPEHRDRILRLYYVGMTRARDRLVLCERSAPRAVDWI